MIMPCMYSTSACERGGSTPFVDSGSVLLGLPGAPGCTTTGLADSACCAPATGPKSIVGDKRPPTHKKKAEQQRPGRPTDAWVGFTIAPQHRPGGARWQR